LGSVVLLTCSYIPHLALYARHRDKEIIASTVIAFGVVLVANSLLVPRYGLHGAAVATLCSMGVMAILKSLSVFKGKKILSKSKTTKDTYTYITKA